MSFSTQVTVLDKASPEVRAKVSGFGGPLNSVMAAAVSNGMKANYLRWNAANANKLGGDRTNLGAQFMRSTHWDLLADGFTVTTSHVAARQRLEGGTIKPTKGNWLTIPARSEAYGKRAREFNNLRFVMFASGSAALVEADSTGVSWGKKGPKAGSSSGGAVMYWLVHEVQQKPDPSVLPSEKELVAMALQAASNTIERTNARAGTGRPRSGGEA